MNKLRDIMTKKVITVPDDMEIVQICNIRCKNSLSGVPVINSRGKLIGFVSERDIICLMASGDFVDKKAKDIMCKKLTIVKEDAKLAQVSKIFTEQPIRHLPVVRKGELVGIISRKDVVGKLLLF